jgi:hypothetical protein
MEGEQHTIENFILAHAIRIPVATETNDYKALFFSDNGLVDMPSCDKMRKNDGSHGVA